MLLEKDGKLEYHNRPEIEAFEKLVNSHTDAYLGLHTKLMASDMSAYTIADLCERALALQAVGCAVIETGTKILLQLTNKHEREIVKLTVESLTDTQDGLKRFVESCIDHLKKLEAAS